MKRLLISAALLLGALGLSACVTYTMYYDYDNLTRYLTRVEIIYFEDRVAFFEVHWFTGVSESDFEVVKTITPDEADELLLALSNTRFTYSIMMVPASVSNVFHMHGYAIRLFYNPPDSEWPPGSQFVIVAQTGDYRHGFFGLSQARTGRAATDSDWSALLSEVLYD